ncbi:MAG TPA: hypothetical protein VK604_18760 [Bryobacteraceae bacterium]|nr:hypothetical protein [Bryobacteraceae bacterium]
MIDEAYDKTLRNMEKCHRLLAASVPPPQAVPRGDGFVLRYSECNVHQALVQKLARVVSGLHSARLLLTHGFFQEQGALQRMLDEFNEDILFLAYSVVVGDTTKLHQDYLEAFFQGEFDDPTSAINSTQKRPMMSRQKIRAYLARIEESGLDPSRAADVMRTINKTYSGFVHGASPQIMEMYDGDPPHFHLSGMLGTTFANDHRNDLWNQFYRSIASFVWSAKAFGDEVMCESILQFQGEFAKANGETYAHPPDGLRR